jgi:histidinol phosphatase-like PHP family hydrolase
MMVDYHIHLHYSPCASPQMTAAAILEKAAGLGIDCVGLVSHVHPQTDLEVFRQAREEISCAAAAFPGTVLLGAEAEMLDQQGGSTLSEVLRGKVDYVMLAVGHVHLPWVRADFTGSGESFLVRETESLLKALNKNKVEILTHPFIYSNLYKIAPNLIGQLWPHRLPLDLVDALARQLCQESTAWEFHCRDLLIRPERLGGDSFVRSYMELLNGLRERGVHFVPGSDAHFLDQIGRAEKAPSWAQGRLPHNPIQEN